MIRRWCLSLLFWNIAVAAEVNLEPKVLSEEPTVNVVPIKVAQNTVTVEVKAFTKGEIQQAIINGLSFLLQERLTDHTLLEDPKIVAALAKPERYLKQYHYLRNVPDHNVLKIQYRDKELDQLLRAVTHEVVLKRTVDLLFWLVMPAQLDQIVNESNLQHQALIKQIKASALVQGLNVIFPVGDFQDQQFLQGNDLLRLDLDKIKKASERYQGKILVIGILDQTLTGKLLIWQNEHFEQLVLQNNLEILWKKVVEQYLPEHEIAVDNKVVTLTLTIYGVRDLQQYKALQQYLLNLSPLIKQTILTSIDNQALTLKVDIIGGEKTLQVILEGQKKLKVVDAEQLIYFYEAINF